MNSHKLTHKRILTHRQRHTYRAGLFLSVYLIHVWSFHLKTHQKLIKDMNTLRLFIHPKLYNEREDVKHNHTITHTHTYLGTFTHILMNTFTHTHPITNPLTHTHPHTYQYEEDHLREMTENGQNEDRIVPIMREREKEGGREEFKKIHDVLIY